MDKALRSEYSLPIRERLHDIFRAGAENVLNKLKARKGNVFWDVPPCTSVKVHPRFGGTCCLRPQVRRVNQTRK
jgi:hypothetical protein